MSLRKKTTCIIGVLLIVVALSMLLMGCPAKDKRKHVVIEVINPLTGEPFINWHGVDLPYDGQPKVFEVRLKTEGRKGKYLTDEDFINHDWKSHIVVGINSKGVSDWQNAWPVEPGSYTVELDFNSPPPFSGKNAKDENYYQATFIFTIQILE